MHTLMRVAKEVKFQYRDLHQPVRDSLTFLIDVFSLCFIRCKIKKSTSKDKIREKPEQKKETS